MQYIPPDVQTVCCGIAMSMGAIILAGGSPGKRAILPNGRVLIHQPALAFRVSRLTRDPRAGGAGAARPPRGDTREHTGQERERVHADMERDHYMTPQEAVEYRIADRIMQERRAIEPKRRRVGVG